MLTVFSVLRGVITLKDIADAENATATGGKKNFMDKIVPRRGVPQGTKLKSAYETADHELLELDMGVCAYPHPFKEQESVRAAILNHSVMLAGQAYFMVANG